MAYLGNGIYDLLDVVRASNDPQINYEGLYQDASAPMATFSLLQSMKPGYEFRNDSYMRNAYLNEGDDLSGNISTDYNRRLDFKNYFNNQPLTPTDGVNRFVGFNPRIGIVNAGLPINNTNSISPINNTSMIEDYPIVSTTNEDETDQQYIQEQEPSGIAKLFEFLGNLPTPMNFIRGFAERVGEPSRYSRFSPGGTFRGGIYNIGGVNTPIQLVNDFYDRTTGLNRFDRAGQRFARTGKTSDLFASSRTLADFVRKKREIDAAKRAESAPVSSASTDGGGGGSWTPSVSASQAAANREGRRGGQYK